MTYFTHKGWFGVCPVYLAGLDGEAPYIHPRHWTLEPLMWFSEALLSFVIFCVSLKNPEWEPSWPIRITGELPVDKVPMP